MLNKSYFDRYIMADYSGAENVLQQEKSIFLADILANGNSVPIVENGYTRKTLSNKIVELLEEATYKRQRVLFGFDHQFSWPMEMLEICEIADKSWGEMLTSLMYEYNGRPALKHPRYFCTSFNRWAAGITQKQGPFYGRLYDLPKQSEYDRLFRYTEKQIAGQPKPFNEIGTKGAVGGQTICGIKELALLREEIKKRSFEVAFWPFDGLSLQDEAYHNKHVCVEIYPTILRPNGIPQTDENDAKYSALICRDMDQSGILTDNMDLSVLADKEDIIRKEGWILGCNVSGVINAFTFDDDFMKSVFYDIENIQINEDLKETTVSRSEPLNEVKMTEHLPANYATTDLHEIVIRLEKYRQRATYGALAGVVGGIANGIGQRLGAKNHRNSWIVNSETGKPTGYSPYEIDPGLKQIIANDPKGGNGHPILRTGPELANWLLIHC